MNEFEAAIGIVQLKKLDRFNHKRRENSQYLYAGINDIDWLAVPTIEPYVEHAFFWCAIQVDEERVGMDTKELRQELMERGVETRHRYNAPLNLQEMLIDKNVYPHECPLSCPFYGREIDYSQFSYPNAERVAGKMLGLPNHPKLKKEELDTVIEVLHDI
jgi:perosamine synthetase